MNSTSTLTSSPSPLPLSVSIFPYPVTVNYIQLPDCYPQLPKNNLAKQPLGYTQGSGTTAYVTVLIPVTAGKMVNNRPIFVFDPEHLLYTLTIVLEPDANVTMSRLAMFSFSFTCVEEPYKVELIIKFPTPDGTGELGKVVMDSNMLPSTDQ